MRSESRCRTMQKGREEERRGTRAETDAERERDRESERRGTERENKGESGRDGYQVCGRKLSCGYISLPQAAGGTQRLTTRNRRRTEPVDSRQKNIRRICCSSRPVNDGRFAAGKYPPDLFFKPACKRGRFAAGKYPRDLFS